MNNKVKDSVILVTGGAGFIGSYVIEELVLLKPKNYNHR
jgi:UDP-glucose 4-epimerase